MLDVEKIIALNKELIEQLRVFNSNVKNNTKVSDSRKIDIKNRMTDLTNIVNEYFPESEYPATVPFKAIKDKVKQKIGYSPTYKDISITFCDSRDFCIVHNGNKPALIRLNDGNRTVMKNKHANIIKSFMDMKRNIEGLNIDETKYEKPKKAKIVIEREQPEPEPKTIISPIEQIEAEEKIEEPQPVQEVVPQITEKAQEDEILTEPPPYGDDPTYSEF